MLSELELTFLFRQLHYLIQSGFSLYPALEMIYLDVGSSAIRKPLKMILGALKEGEMLSSVLMEKLKVPLFVVNMIRVGESNGDLASALQRASVYMEKKVELKKQLTSALSYPALLLSLGLIILVWVNIQILPHFEEIFSQSGILLPLPTRIVFAIHHFLIRHWWNLILGLVVSVGLFALFLRGQLIIFFSKARFSIPVFGAFSYYVTLMTFLTNLGSLHQAGMSLIKSLDLTIQTTSNRYLKGLLQEAQLKIIEGEKLSTALWETQFFPVIVIKMITVGEESAQLDEILIKLNDYLSEELENELKRFMNLIGPISLIIVGIFIAFVSLSFLLPLFRMTGVIHVAR